MKRGVTKDHIEQVLAIDDRVLRNYWVTQSYGDFASALTALLEANTANWCTFGTWASRTVGANMRGEALPEWLHNRVLMPDGLMGLTNEVKEAPRWHHLHHVLTDVTPEHLMDVTRSLLGEMAINLSDGNTEVFAEITPPAAVFIEVAGSGARGSDARARVLAACEGAPEFDGVNRLHAGYDLYCDALDEPDPILKSQKILAGSLQLAIHEQNHLQPVIVSSMDMGVNLAAARLKEKVMKGAADLEKIESELDKALSPAARWIGDTWDDIMTATLGTLQSPEGTMRLDHDVPTPSGLTFVPEDLVDVRVNELQTLLARFNRAKEDGVRSLARNWADFEDRMNFITNLFVSRHHVPEMFAEPFDQSIVESIEADRTPPPPPRGSIE
ncbi:MAG: hypothetical protein ABR963_05025 [Acidimicrobiales bacterium]|jgi:hypothetical protein